jgi:mRNA interferase MazF
MQTRPTTTSRRGDVVLVNFVLSDQSGSKRRPALVLSSETYHQGRQDVIIAAITSNIRRFLPGDTALASWQEAGLIVPSTVTGVLRTVTQGSVNRRLGTLPDGDFRSVEANLRLSLGL